MKLRQRHSKAHRSLEGTPKVQGGLKLILGSVAIWLIGQQGASGDHGKNLDISNYKEGYVLVETETLNKEEHVRIVQKIEDESKLEFWIGARLGAKAIFVVNPEDNPDFGLNLKRAGIQFSVRNPDQMKDVRKKFEPPFGSFLGTFMDAKGKQLNEIHNFDWSKFYSYKEITRFLTKVKQFAGPLKDHVAAFRIGYSFQGRQLMMVNISKAGCGRPNIVIDGGIHAREWASPAATLYSVYKLIWDYLEGNHSVLDKFNFHIIPLMNPDGYEYSRTMSRLWRKTRSVTNGSICVGVDGNRNWAFQFGGKGSSGDSCKFNYRGPYPFSEEEVFSLKNYVLKLSPKPLSTVSVHSFGELVLYPYGYDRFKKPDNVKELENAAKVMAKAMAGSGGKEYKAMISSELYPAAGMSDDYYKGALNVTIPLTVELRDQGEYEFILPPEEIRDTGEELYAGIKALVKHLDKSFAVDRKDCT